MQYIFFVVVFVFAFRYGESHLQVINYSQLIIEAVRNTATTDRKKASSLIFTFIGYRIFNLHFRDFVMSLYQPEKQSSMKMLTLRRSESAFSRDSAPIHWLVHESMTSNNSVFYTRKISRGLCKTISGPFTRAWLLTMSGNGKIYSPFRDQSL